MNPSEPAPAPSTAAPATGAPDPAATQAPREIPGWLHTEGSTIVTESGEPYVIKAVAWFGMETSNCAPHGLWSISLDAGMAQIASMGFTSIRLPFSNECLAQTATTSINASANPGLVDLTPLELMDAVVATAKSYGLTVLLDRHRPDSGAQSELWYTDRFSEATWIADWTALAKRYRDEPAVIGVDLHNEPHGAACWGCGDPAVDWRAAATRAGDAVLAVNPRLLIVVEGVERQGNGDFTWWGGGLADAGDAPVELSVPGRVVYSPHDYPGSIYAQSWFTAADYPANLPGVWDANWGYLATSGTAPVLLGEFGSKLETDADRAWFETIVGYLAANGMSFSYWSFNPNSGDTGGLVQDDWVTPQAEKVAALGPLLGPGSPVAVHAPAAGGVAGGAAGETDAAAPAPAEVPGPAPESVKPWLRPAPAPGGASSGAGGASGSDDAASGAATPGIGGPGSRGKIGGTAAPGLPGPPASAGPGGGGPGTSPDPSATGDAGGGGGVGATGGRGEGATATAGDLSATWTLQSIWESGYVAELAVKNDGGQSGWTASWTDPNATSVVSSWGMSCVVASGTVTCTGSHWAELVSPGETASVGVQVESSTPPAAPGLTLARR
ncbi:cellulase family glycosylhydrolase [Herbiconiux sp. A18JL235]|uniref:Endoglucanase n=1 Tax=Herbiconiux sp. A18JL235 TaxID=3152363 RepID=A0AB39BM31_9MICO